MLLPPDDNTDAMYQQIKEKRLVPTLILPSGINAAIRSITCRKKEIRARPNQHSYTGI